MKLLSNFRFPNFTAKFYVNAIRNSGHIQLHLFIKLPKYEDIIRQNCTNPVYWFMLKKLPG